MFWSFHEGSHDLELLEGCTLCVAARQNADDLHALRSYAFSHLRIYVQDHIAPHLRFSDIEPLEISSSALREAIRSGADTQVYLPPAVAAYIREKGLYGYRTQR